MLVLYCFALSTIILWTPSNASMGDRSPVYRSCLASCVDFNCSSSPSLDRFRRLQSVFNRLLAWQCSDECGYECMWHTVNEFNRMGLEVPQFHGKWPFVRLLGIQEPASVFFSVLNGIPHLINYSRLMKNKRDKTGGKSISTTLDYLWSFYALVSLQTWLSSMLFHSRDLPITETMDYMGAFGLVCSSLLVFIIRALHPITNSTRNVVFAAIAALFAYHAKTVVLVDRIDYGSNMAINIAVGAISTLGWSLWAYRQWQKMPHVKLAFLAILWLNLTISLELLDFPPLAWTLDSHALWHLSTAPVPWIWYRFVYLDRLYISKIEAKKSI